MAEVHRELETTYAVDGDAALPDLVGALPRGHTVTVATHRLRATYVDTADLRLARAGLTLRRRTGGTDAGWHLKVPEAPNTRSELRLPLGRTADRVPRELERLVRGRTRGVPLVPVARITTRRTVHRVADADGTVLVEVADDRVEGARLAGDASDAGVRPDATTQWREVEVEVVDGGPADLAAVDALLTAAGLRAVPDGSKLRRVLAVAVDDADPTPPRTYGRSAASGEVVLAYVRRQVETMAAQDLPVRLGSPGSVHAMRVATRRLRSALTTFGPLFLDDAVAPLRADLRELARALGAARDAEVLRARITADLAHDRPGWAAGTPTVTDGGDALADAGTGSGAAADHGSSTGVQPLRDATGDGARGPDVVPAEAQRWVTGALDVAWRDARARALAELDGDRYAALLVALDAFLAAPPLRHRGSRRARTVLPRLVERTWQKAEAAARRAEAVGTADAGATGDAVGPGEAVAPGEAHDLLLHEVRKAAKRSRYAAEAVDGALGGGADAYAAAMEALQESLGAHHDTVESRRRLHELAALAPSTATAFALGCLHAHEEVRAAEALDAFRSAWKRARKPALRRWLR